MQFARTTPNRTSPIFHFHNQISTRPQHGTFKAELKAELNFFSGLGLGGGSGQVMVPTGLGCTESSLRSSPLFCPLLKDPGCCFCFGSIGSGPTGQRGRGVPFFNPLTRILWAPFPCPQKPQGGWQPASTLSASIEFSVHRRFFHRLGSSCSTPVSGGSLVPRTVCVKQQSCEAFFSGPTEVCSFSIKQDSCAILNSEIWYE